MKKKLGAILMVVALAVTLGLVPAASVGANPDPGIVGLWHLDDGTGSIASDSSGYGNDGTLQPSGSEPSWTPSGNFDGALVFDGSNDYVLVSDANSLDLTSEITLEAWIKAPSTGHTNGDAIVWKDGAYLIQYWNNKINAGVFTAGGWGGSSWLSTASIFDDKCHHIALTYDGSNMRLYIDGGLDTTKAWSGDIVTNSNDLYFGCRTPTTNLFNGLIDEVRIWDEALSVDEIGLDLFDVTVNAEGSALAVDIDWAYGDPYTNVDGTDNTSFTLESIIEGTEVTLVAPLTYSSGVDFYVFNVWDIGGSDPTLGDLDVDFDVTQDITATAEYTQITSLGPVLPTPDYNLVGEPHTVSVDIGVDVAGIVVSFATEEPTGPQDLSARELGTGTTGSDGIASLDPSYTSNDAGIDTIYAYIDVDGSSDYTADEPHSNASAVKYWFLNFVTGGGHIKYGVDNGKKTIEKPAWNFSGNVGYFAVDSSIHGQFNIIDHVGKMQYHCHDEFSSLVFYGGTAESPEATFDTAEFTGTFTDKDGATYELTIIIVDNGEPGKDTDQISVTGAGFTTIGLQTIDGGNYQIHEGYKG